MGKSIYVANKVFESYGHKCTMVKDLDVAAKYISGEDKCSSFKRYLMRGKMIYELHPRTQSYLRSQAQVTAIKREHIRRYPYMIHPFSKFRMYWEFLMILVIALGFFFYPLDLIMHVIISHENFHLDSQKIGIFLNTLDVIRVIDMVIEFFTAYWNVNTTVFDMKSVSKRYLMSTFVTDFLGCVPQSILLPLDIDYYCTPCLIVLIILRLLIVFYATRFREYLILFAKVINMHDSLGKFTAIAFFFLAWIHWIACCEMYYECYYLQLWTRINGTSRKATSVLGKIQTFDEMNEHQFELYIYYLFTAVKIANHVTPMSPETYEVELYWSVSFTLITWVLSRLLFILLTANLYYLLRGLKTPTNKYDEMVRQLKEYMFYKGFNRSLQQKLLLYYEFSFNKSYFRESEIIASLSGHLRQDIVMHCCRNLAESLPFLKNIPLVLLVRIVASMNSEVFLTNDVVIKVYTEAFDMYFISSGTVAVYTPSGQEVCHLKDGNFFGEIALILPQQRRAATVVAIETCELYKLNRKDFMRAIQPFPDLFEQMEKTAIERAEQTSLLEGFTSAHTTFSHPHIHI